MKNNIKKFLLIIFSIIFFYNFSFAKTIDPLSELLLDNGEKQENINFDLQQIDIFGNNLDYEIGFYNTISNSNKIFDIKLNFQNEFQGELNIYEPINYNSKKNKLYKSLKINGKTNIFQFKASNNLSFFIKDKLGNKKELKGINYKYSESIYLSNHTYECKQSYICTDNLDYSILSLLSYSEIVVNKEITDSEKEILLEYIYKGGQIIINESNFSKYFQNIIKKDLWNEIDDSIYSYGLGTIQISSIYNEDDFYSAYIDRSFLTDETLQKILIDDEIKSKYLDYWIILIFVCIYFIIIIPINFLIKKKNGNKLFFIYSIPTISLVFVVLLIIMNIIVKGVYKVENKLEINIIKDGKVYQQIYTLDFTPNGGDYQILLEQDDTVISDINSYNYYYYNDKKEWNIQNNKFSINFEKIKSSEIMGFRYGRIKDYDVNYFNVDYDNTYNKWKEFTDDYIILEENKNSYYRGNYDILTEKLDSTEALLQIKKIGVNKILDKEYSNKYSLGGKEGYKLRVDIYY